MTEKVTQPPLLEDYPFEVADEDDGSRALVAFPRQPEAAPISVKKLWMKNLKGFRSLEVELGQFNVLVGPNNCGKSTVLQALDLCFRLMQSHVEFQHGLLARPRAGKQVVEEMLPVARPEDFWHDGRYRVGNERIPVTVGVLLASGCEFEFEIKRQWGGLNSRMTKYPEGQSESLIRDILAKRPTLVPSVVGVVKQEEWRVPARVEQLSMTGHHNEVLRNYLLELSGKKPELFQSVQDLLKQHFGARIDPVTFDSSTDQFISARYRNDASAHDVFSAGSGFLQVLQMLTYLYLETPGIILLDEPDAHLHSSMQRLVVDLLEKMGRQQGIQVVMATHSKEIINYVDASHIVPMTRDMEIVVSMEHHSSVLPILQDLGAVVSIAARTRPPMCG